jgi:hypothetical protein
METKGKGGVWKGTPDKTAPGFPEKDYKESLKADPPKSEYASGSSESMGPNDPGYGR